MLIISPAESADMAEKIYRGYVVGIPTAMGNSATGILRVNFQSAGSHL